MINKHLFLILPLNVSICTNGFITFVEDTSRSSLSIPYRHTVLFMYARDLNARSNPILYRITNETTILNRADEDVRRFSKDNFTSKYVVIVTFGRIMVYGKPEERQSFQAVIASSYNETYVIMNYANLNVKATTGFYDNDCGFGKTINFTDSGDSRLLAESSNVGVKGRHVHLLTSGICEGNFYI